MSMKARCITCLAILESVETLSLAPFCRVLGFSPEDARRLATDVKNKANNRKLHAYNILHHYQAQTPCEGYGI